MRELLKTKGYKSTPQRELIIDCFLSMGKHVTVDELYRKVCLLDPSVGHSTVWRNLKLICQLGLAEEVNIGDGITRYDRTTAGPHGHLFCRACKKLVEFDVDSVFGALMDAAQARDFEPDGFKVEIQGYCDACRRAGRSKDSETSTGTDSARRSNNQKRRGDLT